MVVRQHEYEVAYLQRNTGGNGFDGPRKELEQRVTVHQGKLKAGTYWKGWFVAKLVRSDKDGKELESPMLVTIPDGPTTSSEAVKEWQPREDGGWTLNGEEEATQ
jgi:hypothetical protein